jgi:deoxycytidylate deaminase
MSTPRKDEFAMNVAFKAAAGSACLSRQVGAAIVDSDGHLLATGCNDVPKFGGGLYTSEDKEDKRCWAKGGKCYNDDEKSLIVEELVTAFSDKIESDKILDYAEGLALGKVELEQALMRSLKSSLDSSRIRQLIEFSRAVHAEMDAIMAVARTGRRGIVGGTIYCTTYPCHNCTKHIIDVGIQRLVYLEPYEKSLAKKLHSDAISDSGDTSMQQKVAFQLYNGVSPARYAEFFEMRQPRKENGRYIDRSDEKSKLLPLIRESADELWRRILKELGPDPTEVGDEQPARNSE